MNDCQHEHILKTISIIRDSFDKSVDVYTKGSCYRFAKLLKHIYPQGQILYDSSHAIFECQNKCYDITGEVKKARHISIENYDIETLEQLRYAI
ncbi:MAG: hypothetical protein ACRC1D_03430 [Culicoidibacterales bacterium]